MVRLAPTPDSHEHYTFASVGLFQARVNNTAPGEATRTKHRISVPARLLACHMAELAAAVANVA